MQLSSNIKKTSFSIPSGNYGNLFSSVISKKLGLPIEHIISSNNINNPVERYFKYGIYNALTSKETLSNAMDIGDPSNFKRVQTIFDSDLRKMKNMIYAFSFSDTQTKNAIKELLDNFNYISDPHGAIGYLGAKKYINDKLGSQCIFLETAHYFKFYDEIKSIINKEHKAPSQLNKILNKVNNSIQIKNYNQFKDYLNLTI